MGDLTCPTQVPCCFEVYIKVVLILVIMPEHIIIHPKLVMRVLNLSYYGMTPVSSRKSNMHIYACKGQIQLYKCLVLVDCTIWGHF